ncbi:MAG: endonuclease III [Acholeplasmataceae bacterium]|jgi:endonuclease-3|nr:endonuclease III [Acholeplasmataceae bacterium]
MSIKSKKIIEALDSLFPNAKIELTHKNTYELIIAVILSAQTTDVSVNKVTPKLFKKYPNIDTLSKANIEDVIKIIKSIGLYRTKAKNIILMANQVKDNFNGEIPNTRTDLESLAGVGRKTANVVLANAFDKDVIAVDTHIHRISIRLGIAKKTANAREVEESLYKFFPKENYLKLHHQLIFFGRYHCLARNPKCLNCPLYDICVYENKMA